VNSPTSSTDREGNSYRERPPARALAGLVSSTWVQRISPDAGPYPHRSVPNGSVELVCHLGSAPRIIGPLTEPRVELLPPGTVVVGLRFRPGAAAGVLGLPATELADIAVDAEELWGRTAVAAGERLARTGSDRDLQAFVVGRLADAARPDPLVAEAVRRLMAWREGAVRSLESSLYVSERQLRRRCLAAIGVGPKTLHRMLRFQRVLAQIQYGLTRGDHPALGALAADAGYADQAHLTRECVRLTGVTPQTFRRETERECGCGHDHQVSYAPLLTP
jgi:AraC-like DNA-binding protein